MTPITVACVWVRGNVPYTAEYVDRLAGMARRALPGVRVVCLTDRPAAVPEGIEPHVICPTPGANGWWAKVHLFNPATSLRGRVLYLDLDTLVVGDLQAIVDLPVPFATVADHGSTFRPRNGLRVIKRFNSSVMVFDAGVYPDLFTAWSLSVAQRLWGDQDWIAERHPDSATFPEAWCPRLSQIDGPPFGEARVILSKVPKNEEAARRWPWFNAIWRAV